MNVAVKPSKSRLLDLTKLTCKLFKNVYNPDSKRTGNKILRQNLIGPTVTNWYPTKLITIRQITDMFPEMNLINLEEKQRLDDLTKRKRRGKGAPKKGLS